MCRSVARSASATGPSGRPSSGESLAASRRQDLPECSEGRILLLLAAEPEGERGEDHPGEPPTRGHPGECADLIRVPRKGPVTSGSHSGEKVGEGADIDQVWSRDRVRR